MTRAGRGWRGATALLCAVTLTSTSARGQEPSSVERPGDDEPTQPESPEVASEAPTSDEAPRPPDQAAALEAFREGVRHYDARRYAEAAEAFDRSLAAAWSINALYNKAQSLDRASDLVAALAAYREYLARAEADDRHRSTALARSEQLRQRLGEVLLQIDSPEAIREIRVNGETVDADAFPRLTLPGPLDVEFVGEAGQRKNIRADVRAGGAVTIVFPGFVRPQVRPVEPAKPPIGATQPVESQRHKGLRAGFWATTSLTLAGGVTVAVLGSRVLVYGRREAGVCDPMCDESEAREKDRLREQFGTYKTATNVAVALTAAAGVVALALGIALKRERSRGTASTRAGVRWLGSAIELTF